MNTIEIASINVERLKGWGTKLTQLHSTPFLTIGVGHDHRQGEVTLLACEDTPVEDLIALLSGVLHHLQLQKLQG